MSDEAAEVRRLLAPLRDRPMSVDHDRLLVRRERTVNRLKQQVRSLAAERSARRLRRLRWSGVLAAAAAVALFTLHTLLSRRPAQVLPRLEFVGGVGSTMVRSGSSKRPLRAGEVLVTDPGEVETADSGMAELMTSAGLGLRLGNATRVSLAGLVAAESRNQLELRQGLVTCSVPHLHEGQHFSVQTPDARVTVHGTVFSVRVDRERPSGSETCVKVTEGVVIVQHGGTETALNAGEQYGCEVAAAVEPGASRQVAQSPEPLTPEPRTAQRRTPRVLEHGTLAEETRLFQAALTAERLGQRDRAQAHLEQLLMRYPNSPLSSEARSALSRVAGMRPAP